MPEPSAADLAALEAVKAQIIDMKKSGAGKEEIGAAVAELKRLKAACGEEVLPSGKDKKKEKKEAAPEPEKTGPSKKDLKKAEKAAGKAADKATAKAPAAAPQAAAPAKPATAQAKPATAKAAAKPAAATGAAVTVTWSGVAPIAASAAASFVGAAVTFTRDDSAPSASAVLSLADGARVRGSLAIARYFARTRYSLAASNPAAFPLGGGLYGMDASDPFLSASIDRWTDLAAASLWDIRDPNAVTQAAQLLDAELSSGKPFLAAQQVTVADLAVYEALATSPSMPKLKGLMAGACKSLGAWFARIAGLAEVVAGLASLGDIAPAGKAKEGGKDGPSANTGASEGTFVPLQDIPGGLHGNVVTRFPPEPSGYMHLGHVKASMLNSHFARKYNGKMIVRFDDTNPSKEKQEFEDTILEDLTTLGITWDRLTHTSDHFPLLLAECTKVIKSGKAYVDTTPQLVMKEERANCVENACRSHTIEQNLALWGEMQAGTEVGLTACVRAKMDMKNPNGCLRDPAMYRTNLTPHHQTKTKYKVYPTYDFACPLVDSLEGVTHALRTNEYKDRDAQYDWFLDIYGGRRVHIWEFSRLNMVYTVLSKRKLTWFVDTGLSNTGQKLVNGWDDPRMPTVRGILRRGMTVEGLRTFILSQGSSMNNNYMEWDKIWTINKKVIDPVVPRFTALYTGEGGGSKKGLCTLSLSDGPKGWAVKAVDKHPKDKAMGHHLVRLSDKLLIEEADAAALSAGEEFTMMTWGNAVIDKKDKDKPMTGHLNLAGDVKKTELKATWIADCDDLVQLELVTLFNGQQQLITKTKLEPDDEFDKAVNRESSWNIQHALGDQNLKGLRRGDMLQLNRKGFYIVDRAFKRDGVPMVLLAIPDGHLATKAGTAGKKEKKKGGAGSAVVKSDVPTAVTDVLLNVNTIMRTLFTDAVRAALPVDDDYIPNVSRAQKPEHGHYQCNAAMSLFKQLKGKLPAEVKSPMHVAELIKTAFEKIEWPLTAKVVVAPPGFVNLHLDPKFFADSLSLLSNSTSVTSDDVKMPAPVGGRKTVVVDFSSPNIAKDMHVGHLRSTILGDVMCRMLEAVGHDVHRTNHVGDWGTQFGMLIANLKDKYSIDDLEAVNIKDLVVFYKEAKKRFDEDGEFQKRAYQEVVNLQGGSEESLKGWNFLCDTSRLEFQRVYDRLGVRLTEKGESFYNPLLPGVVKELCERDMVHLTYKAADGVEDVMDKLPASGVIDGKTGAKVITVPGYSYPLMVQKTNGGYGYGTTDCAAVRYRAQEVKADWCVYVVDAGQADHLNMVFDVSRLANWTVDPKSAPANVKAATASGARPMRLDHMKFGVVLGEDGKKFKTRSGATVKLSDLLDEAAERFLADFKTRLEKEGAKTEVPEAEFEKVSRQIGYAAVKYADLHQNRETDYKFSYDKMLQSTGDTAVYLLYTHARIASILRKAKDEKGVDTDKVGTFPVSLDHPSEVLLASEIMKLPEALEMAIDEMKPSHMTKFLYDTCQSFSNFYTQCKVLHTSVPDDVRDSRLVLVAACGAALRKGFAVLGIDPLYRI